MSQRCYPGPAHPNAPLEIPVLARRFGVDPDQVQSWLESGLPQVPNGTIDPFVCCNWLSWGPLETAPALQRLWRQFTAHFQPFKEGRDTGRALQWQRSVVLYVPEDVSQVVWHITKMQDVFSTQHAQLRSALTHGQCYAETIEHDLYYSLFPDEPQPHAHMAYDVQIQPQRVLDEQDADYKTLLPIFTDIVAEFEYQYRVHELDDQVAMASVQGTCLDSALYAAAVLTERGFNWRLCGGVIGHSALLNAHHWLEVETAKGWAPFDVSIPAIMRMLQLDWQAWCRVYCGGLDSGRISLSRGPGFWDVPEHNFISAATGTATVVQNGNLLNAWPCLDWVCGECDGQIKKL